jgi:hypothetical protein
MLPKKRTSSFYLPSSPTPLISLIDFSASLLPFLTSLFPSSTAAELTLYRSTLLSTGITTADDLISLACLEPTSYAQVNEATMKRNEKLGLAREERERAKVRLARVLKAIREGAAAVLLEVFGGAN